ncbi:hypothetical protein RDWZM_009461 [Blomia tropicalis]|uniref:Uncharacterized protein n=1 Tax=Blomia tropicalis TaxID=40697 RepID=A0A9Q0RL16_BLOTA|nr:hypothetical protein RDWZM_009461 [Blomia tropicalis]
MIIELFHLNKGAVSGADGGDGGGSVQIIRNERANKRAPINGVNEKLERGGTTKQKKKTRKKKKKKKKKPNKKTTNDRLQTKRMYENVRTYVQHNHYYPVGSSDLNSQRCKSMHHITIN